MVKIIQQSLKELNVLCRKYHVKELYLFGSAADGDFNQATSDLDFVVTFDENIQPEDFAENYFSFLDALELLFGRQVDLLSYRALKNQVMIDEIEQTKIPLYAA